MNQGTNQIWTSADLGQHWRLAAQGSEEGPTVGNIGPGMMGQLTVSHNGQVLWLLGDVNGIAISTNGGSDWSGAPVNSMGYQTALATAGATGAWLPIPGVGLFRTINGTSWAKVSASSAQ